MTARRPIDRRAPLTDVGGRGEPEVLRSTQRRATGTGEPTPNTLSVSLATTLVMVRTYNIVFIQEHEPEPHTFFISPLYFLHGGQRNCTPNWWP